MMDLNFSFFFEEIYRKSVSTVNIVGVEEVAFFTARTVR